MRNPPLAHRPVHSSADPQSSRGAAFNVAALPDRFRPRRRRHGRRRFREETPMAANLKFSNPSTIAKPPGYTHVVEATGPNRLIYIAGQLGLDLDNKLVGPPGDFRAQAVQAFENLKAALASAGAGIEHAVKINNYLVD